VICKGRFLTVHKKIIVEQEFILMYLKLE
jgi:hypothetical protein